jgi:predicted nucleic acid-binding protein
LTHLLDTVVVSDAMKRQPNPAVLEWLASHGAGGLYISVVTLGEIQRGISAIQAREALFARRLQVWLAGLQESYGERVLRVTAPIALRWGHLSADLGNDGYDLMIAATALEHDLAVVTRNLRHFDGTGVRLVNPFGD